VKTVEGEDYMEEKPTIRLTWKKAVLIMTLCLVAVSDRAGHIYHLK
jgi:hypothetical protein